MAPKPAQYHRQCRKLLSNVDIPRVIGLDPGLLGCDAMALFNNIYDLLSWDIDKA